MRHTSETPAVTASNESERTRRTAANGGDPTLDFERVPYDDYVHASTLHRLQRTLSDDPGEMSFLMISQVMELYFGLVHFELGVAQERLRADDVWESLLPLRRAALHLEGLNAGWQTLRWMTPGDFNRFRDLLGEGSGFQSAMYRKLEFRLGLKTASLIRPFRNDPAVHGDLENALAAPSLWDDVIRVLARHGHDVPGSVLSRDLAEEHTPDPAVESAWVRIYDDPGPGNHLRMLGEALTEVAEQFGDWRYRHLQAVQRSMGARVGTGGSSGLAWLRRSMERVVFPELFSARTVMN
ncbi:tryptophan 2,3-dioxygenase [Prauserella sp. PE36]|uniref:Tryptophan 2,3-dioxygenase n=1 Tax=Prauserella endophytica TaxID=1592324 RepID=A0ABY2S9A9_9PSEU|nr:MULTISPECIES: tryptophan 2,3-dioxygenase family protein [Prauserella]PXY23122.1 tryptophan 2,3-dioxygenase [Prauserella coralliicola]RBM17120.1 tryptophan 2,3-dioxygenase [Prauserella sp. PE36]TKG72485.1 tryptophan 2,3-dioxygenase [Prauserella endophytica]